MNDFAPIIVFAYKRADHITHLLQSLKLCPEHAVSPITIYCDGPRKIEDRTAVEEARATVRKHAPQHAQIIERPENFGLAKSIITGVTEACNQYGRVIVLEDDLDLAPNALGYFNGALTRYQDDERVMHIAGYMFPIAKDNLPPLFFHREATCWGWATWARAWANFDSDAQNLEQQILASHNTKNGFNIDGGANYTGMLRAQVEGHVNSWAIRWYASVFLNNGLALHPRDAITRNLGNDGTGEHCGATNRFDVSLGGSTSFVWPGDVQQNKLALQRIRAFWLQINPPTSFLRRVKNKIRRLLKGER